MERRHEIPRFLGRLHERMDELDTGRVWSLSTEELGACLEEAYAAQARLAQLTLALLAQAEATDLPTHDGLVSLVAWLRDRVRLAPAEGKRQIQLARSLTEHALTREALAAGGFPAASAAVITHAVDSLPPDLDPQTRARAEEHLAGEAHAHDTSALRRLADHLDEVIDPDGADIRLAASLARAEAKADREAYVHLHHDELSATTDGTFRVPLLTGRKLQRMLESLLNPDRPVPQPTTDPATGVRLTAESRRGHAMVELVDRIPLDRLPTTGGCDPTVIVTIDLTTLRGGPTPAHLDTGEAMSPGLARRLAAQAGIIPAVLGTDSEVLDLGRKTRLFTKKQRLAMLTQQNGTCAVIDCTRPGAWGEAHHLTPWSTGGPTDLTNGVMICKRHHTLVDHPDYRVTQPRPGRIEIRRRT